MWWQVCLRNILYKNKMKLELYQTSHFIIYNTNQIVVYMQVTMIHDY